MMTSRWAAGVLAVGAAFAAVACGSTTNASAPVADAGPACVDTGEHPPARSDTAGVVDAKRHRIVFFGGDTGVPKQCNPAPVLDGELWTYDLSCKTFARVSAADGPSSRSRAATVYDPDGDRMIVFGGRARAGSSSPYTLFNEVWALDLPTLAWQKVTTSGTPPSARSSAAAAYAPATKELVLFGGNQSTNGAQFQPLADVWALNLATGAWRAIAGTGKTPAARMFHAVTIDPGANRLYAFGGGDANAFTGPFLGDLSSIDLASGAWQVESAGGAGAPASRINATATFDAKAGRLLLFGGHDDGAVGNNNDTWSFDPASKAWTAIVPPETLKKAPPGFCLFPPDFTTTNTSAPERRSAHLAALDTTRGAWTIYGGATDCGLIDDVWSFDLTTNAWSRAQKAQSGEACVRGDRPQQCSTLCL
jgi:hypothetical protein